jgi:hypothetical protein
MGQQVKHFPPLRLKRRQDPGSDMRQSMRRGAGPAPVPGLHSHSTRLLMPANTSGAEERFALH